MQHNLSSANVTRNGNFLCYQTAENFLMRLKYWSKIHRTYNQWLICSMGRSSAGLVPSEEVEVLIIKNNRDDTKDSEVKGLQVSV